MKSSLKEGGEIEFEAVGCEDKVRREEDLIRISELERRVVQGHGFAITLGSLLSHFWRIDDVAANLPKARDFPVDAYVTS